MNVGLLFYMVELKIIKGYENYAATSNGHVFDFVKDDFAKESLNTSGYFQVCIRNDDGIYKRLLVHRLVAETFIPNPCNYSDVDHIDGTRTNNAVENLRWCTRQQNLTYPIAIERKKEAMNRADVQDKIRKTRNMNPNTAEKPVTAYSKDGVFIGTWRSIREAGRHFGIVPSNILYCCKGKKKSAGGMCWRYSKNDL